MSPGNPIRNRTLRREFITTLPSEIIINILIRLPIRAILCCKCVCKSLLHLIETHEFANSHLSMSVPVLAICHEKSPSNLYRIFEIEDRFDLEHLELFRNPVTTFDLPYHGRIHGSANGFLLLHDHSLKPDALYIFNPITRDCIELCCPPEFVGSYSQRFTSGFGASKITGQLKVVRICQGYRPSKSECQVYTLGTRSWRKIAPGAYLKYGCDTSGTFLNGNLHWLAFDSNGSSLISCFDLELELFSTLYPPTIPSHAIYMENMFASGDCLCICDNRSNDALVIWSMKEYGVESSWTKEFFISISAFTGDSAGTPFRINVFKDGDILILWECGTNSLFYYSEKDSAAQKIDMFEPRFIDAILYTPSFLSLMSFRRENLSSF